MKYFLLIIFVIVSFIDIYSQDCRTSFDEKKQEPMLVGTCNRSAFAEEPYSIWFKENYDKYVLDSVTISKINADFNSITISIVMGTWCGDSREFVPPFLKLLDKIAFPESSIKLIMVDRSKKGIADETENLNIERVPTFIFYNNGSEIGRIIETPNKSVEKDFLKITGQ